MVIIGQQYQLLILIAQTRLRRPGFKSHPIEFMVILDPTWDPYLEPPWTNLNLFGPIKT